MAPSEAQAKPGVLGLKGNGEDAAERRSGSVESELELQFFTAAAYMRSPIESGL